jgi:hypothetical protein
MVATNLPIGRDHGVSKRFFVNIGRATRHGENELPAVNFERDWLSMRACSQLR